MSPKEELTMTSLRATWYKWIISVRYESFRIISSCLRTPNAKLVSRNICQMNSNEDKNVKDIAKRIKMLIFPLSNIVAKQLF